MRCLLDTGVLLRMFDRSDPDRPDIIAALKRIQQLRYRPVIAIQNAVEFWNVMTRPASARGGYGLSAAITEQRLRHLERRFQILPETIAVFAEWKRLSSSLGITGKSVHDARLVAQMLVSQIHVLLTLNVGDFRRYSTITALTPADFVKSNPATRLP